MKKKINIIKIFSLVLTLLIICVSGFNLKVHAGPSADSVLFYVYDNEGLNCLFSTTNVFPDRTYTINESGIFNEDYQYQIFEYSGDNKFIGFSTKKNSYELTYAIGDSISDLKARATVNLYIVEEGINKLISLEGAKVTVPAGWSASAEYGRFYILGSFEIYNNNGDLNSQGTFWLNDYNWENFGIGYYIGDGGWDTSVYNPIGFMTSMGNGVYVDENDVGFYFKINITGGTDATKQELIDWFINNGATIEGGIYSDDVVSVTNDIGDTKLVWELNWLETTEETVSDYVAIYPLSDTKQCYIVFKKSFDIPMELIVKSEDESIYASCDVDCYERTETVGSASLSVSLDGSTNSDLLLGQDVEENEITFNGNTSYETIFTDQTIEINSMTATTSKVGTLATTQEVSYNVGLSEELQTLLEDREITFVSTTSNLITSTVKGLLESLITFTDDNKEVIYEALNTCDNWFRIDVEVVDKYDDKIINEYLYTINIIGFVINDYYATSGG